MNKVLQSKVKPQTFIANGSLNMMFIVHVSEQNGPKERAAHHVFVFTGKWFSQTGLWLLALRLRAVLYFCPEEHFD